MQILKPNEMPRKLRFYLAPGQTDAHISTVKYQFGEYVKPGTFALLTFPRAREPDHNNPP